LLLPCAPSDDTPRAMSASTQQAKGTRLPPSAGAEPCARHACHQAQEPSRVHDTPATKRRSRAVCTMIDCDRLTVLRLVRCTLKHPTEHRAGAMHADQPLKTRTHSESRKTDQRRAVPPVRDERIGRVRCSGPSECPTAQSNVWLASGWCGWCGWCRRRCRARFRADPAPFVVRARVGRVSPS
jgi:hypothetical protein